MDEVELVLIEPEIFGIIDDELEIRWDAVMVDGRLQTPPFRYSQDRLTRTQINAKYLTFRMLIGCVRQHKRKRNYAAADSH